MMKENRKIVIERLGESFRDCTNIVTEPLREPGPKEVLVRNHFAGVNGVYDQMMCLDRVDHTKVVPPADAGVEAVGVIERVGPDVATLQPGTPVAVVSVGGGYRMYQYCQTDAVIPVPDASPQILALIPSGVSALLALERVGEMTTGEIVCVTAAAGGLGNILVQLAANAGNEVVAICGSDEKVKVLEDLGARRALNYRRESVAEVIASDYEDKLDLVMDSVGGALFDVLVASLAPFGRLVVCGFTSDRVPTEVVPQERIYTKLYWKAASVRGFMNYRFSEHAPDARRRLLTMLATGMIRPLVDAQPFEGLESVADAVDHLLAGNNIGKVVVDLRGQ